MLRKVGSVALLGALGLLTIFIGQLVFKSVREHLS